jgi:hypothetical protein
VASAMSFLILNSCMDAISLSGLGPQSSEPYVSVIGHNSYSFFSLDCGQISRMWPEMDAVSLFSSRPNDKIQEAKLLLNCGQEKLHYSLLTGWKCPQWYFVQPFEQSANHIPRAQDSHLTYLIIIPIWKLHKKL